MTTTAAQTLPLFKEPSREVKLPLLTNSRLKTWRRCARLHELQYEQGYRAIERHGHAPLHFGDLVHRGLEAWWRAVQSGRDPLDAALEVIDRVAMARRLVETGPGDADPEADPFERARARVLLIGYHERWGAEPYEVIAVEAEYRAPLVNPDTGAPSKTWRLAGKLDVLLRDLRLPRLVFMEHKTSAEDIGTGSVYWQRLRMDSQVSAYFAGAAALGHQVDACVYDIIGKPDIRPLKATSEEQRRYTKEKRNKTGELVEPSRLYANQRESDETPEEFEVRLAEAVGADADRYYQRGEVVRLEEEMRDHLRDVWQQAKAIRHAQLTALAPRNPDACLTYGRPCSFFDVCTGQASLNDPTRFVRIDNVHPELDPELTPDEASLPNEEAAHGNTVHGTTQ